MSSSREPAGRSVLFIDTAYTLREVREKKHESFFRARHASGFFQRVYSVHPIADAVGAPKYRIDVRRFGPGHVVIEGKVELFRWPRLFRPVNFLCSQLRLYRLLSRIVRRRQVSAVMAADPFYSALLGLALARRHARPFGIRIGGNADEIYEATGALAMPRLLPSYRLQRWVQRFVLKRADLVAGINQNNLQFGIANGARKHTRVIPISSNVADVHRTPADERGDGRALLRRLGVPADGPLLLYLGRLLELKHPDDALRAMAFNISRHPQAVGLLIGAGPMEQKLRELAQELEVEASIHFLGQVDQHAISQIVPHCIMFSPSAGQLALLECALGGAAIVAYDRDFQSEFIEDGVNGFKVRFRDVDEMARRGDLLIRDPSVARRLSLAARSSALVEVDPERVKRVEWEAFERLVSARGGGAQS